MLIFSETRKFEKIVKIEKKKFWDTFLLYGGYKILVQKVFERDLSRDGKCKKIKF